jgi:hypothetical protein
MNMTEIFSLGAGFDLQDAVCGMIASQMAEALNAAHIDVTDEEAVISTLYAAGFGSASIVALHRRAADLCAVGCEPTF